MSTPNHARQLETDALKGVLRPCATSLQLIPYPADRRIARIGDAR